MKRRALVAFVVAVDLLALASFAVLPLTDLRRDPGALFLLVVLAGVTGARPIRIPALRTEVTACDPFVFAAMAYLGGLPAAFASIAGILGATVMRSVRPSTMRLAFNLGAVVFPTVLGYAVFDLAGGAVGGPLTTNILPLALATTVYFVSNTGLVTVAIALDQGAPFFRTWRTSGLWTGISSYTGLTLAAGLLYLLDVVGPWGLALGIPPCLLLVNFYRTHKDRLEQQQQRIDQVIIHNVELESKVRERTAELEQAVRHIEQANRDLRLANKRLSEANRTKSAFLANVSHELRTPLNAIIGFSELLCDDSFGELNPDQKSFGRDIRDSGVHLLSLINDILDLSKIEAGKMTVHRERISLAAVVDEAVAMIRTQAKKKELELTVEADREAHVDLDPGMFRQILVNLLSNAVKFTGPGGSVDVKARPDGRDLRVDVADTGIGIADQDRQRVFEEFFQVDDSYSRNYEGTGLGLALVQRMVRLHGGSVAVESTPGEGTTFTVRFPVCVAAGPREAAPAPAPRTFVQHQDAGGTVLVVEDNRINRKLVRNVLRSRGYRVIEAESGEKALEMLASQLPDLVLLDIQLPGMDGHELVRRLKLDPRARAIPVVALTANAQKADEQRAIEAGCSGYIAKPIRLNRFPAQIREFLAGETVSGPKPVAEEPGARTAVGS